MDGLALATVFNNNGQRFINGWTYPILLIRTSKEPSPFERSVFDTPDPEMSSQDTSQSSSDGNSFEDYLNPDTVMLPLCKSNRNAFSHMITFGRASNNDICLAEPTISKLHGWFLVPTSSINSWRYVDNTSTNGTTINRHKVKAQDPNFIKFGDEIIAGQVRILFLAKENILDLMEYMANETKKTKRMMR